MLARSLEVLKNHSNVIPVLMKKCGYYEIDDIIFFPSDDLLKEQGSIIKLRRTPKTIL
jgi:hypothetical protein